MNILNMFKKPKTFEERYVAYMNAVKELGLKYNIDIIPTLSVKDLSEPTPTPEAPAPVNEAPVKAKKKKGGKKSRK